MKGRNPTAEEKRYMSAAAEMGCIICLLYLDVFTPGAIHHIDGKTKPGAHSKAICLCDKHHQHRDNEKPQRWVSRHGDGRAAFKREYQPEMNLLAITIQKLNESGYQFNQIRVAA